ncbi:MAG: glycosyltransferase family 39 protein [Candidatus Omnitrophota bacterium]
MNDSELMYGKGTYLLLFCLIFVIALGAVLYSLQYITYNIRGNEGCYLKYAAFIKDNGIAKFPTLYEFLLENEKGRAYPSLLRLGFVLLCSFWIRVFGQTFSALSSLSVFSYCLLLVICYYFSKKHFSDKIALWFTMLVAFSPLNMYMARRALPDSTATMLFSLAIWAFYDLVKKKTPVKYLIFGLALSNAILIKEPAVILSLAFSLYLLYMIFYMKKGFYIKGWMYTSLLLLLIVGVLYLISTGGFVLFSPWVFTLAVGFMLYSILRKRLDEKVMYFLFIFIFVLAFLCSGIFTSNIRHIVVLDMLLRIFFVLMLKELFETYTPKYSNTLISVVVITISVFGYLAFMELFFAKGIYDPMSF